MLDILNPNECVDIIINFKKNHSLKCIFPMKMLFIHYFIDNKVIFCTVREQEDV